MFKIMTAKWSTKCNLCESSIKKGDSIVVDKLQPRKKRSFCCGECATQARAKLDKATTQIEVVKPKPIRKLTSFKGVFA